MTQNNRIIPDNVYNSVVKLIVSNITFDFLKPFNRSKQETSIGTGFFIDKHHLLTAAHVIRDSTSFIINFPETGQTIFNGTIIAVYPEFDIALLKLKDATSDYFIELGNSDTLELGEPVYVLGYPDNSQHPLNTRGTISGLRDDNIQTDAALNHGNSGGPLLNKHNQVIGINSSIFEDSDGVGFAIPINFFINVKKTMLLPTSAKILYRPTIGITVQSITPDFNHFFKRYNIPKNRGVMIKSISEKSPLHKVAIDTHDIILQIDDYDIDNFGEINVKWSKGKLPFSSIIKRKQPGDVINLTIYNHKSSTLKTIPVILDGIQNVLAIREYFPYMEDIPYEIFGSLIFMNLSLNHFEHKEFIPLSSLLLQHKLGKGKVIICHQFPNSSLSHYNIIRIGQVVKSLNNINISNITDLRRAMLHPFKIKVPEKVNKQEPVTLYFKLELEDGTLLYFNLTTMYKEDLIHQKQYQFKLTKGWKRIYKKLGAQ